MSNCKELWIARRKHQRTHTARKDHKLGKRDGVPHRERQKDRGREDAVLYEKSLIDLKKC